MNKSRYSYDLEGFAYKKLSNGYFDNLLIKEKFGFVSQNKKRLTAFNQVLSSIGKSESQFQKDKDEFANFVDSIKAYKPIPKTFHKLEAVSGEDPQITAIMKYYWLLTNGNLSEAYNTRFAYYDKGFFKRQKLS